MSTDEIWCHEFHFKVYENGDTSGASGAMFIDGEEMNEDSTGPVQLHLSQPQQKNHESAGVVKLGYITY